MKTKNKILLFSALFFFVLYLLTACKDDDETTPVIIDDNYGTPCEGSPTVNYGGQTYNTVKVGDQCWLRENLNIGTMIYSVDTLKNNDTIEKYCYDNEAANCEKYGGMYNWNELMKYNDSVAQGICPDGWRVPTDTDWTILESNLDSLYTINDTIWDTLGWRGYNAGGMMKKMGTDDWYYPNIGATNTKGFSAVPAGIRFIEDKSFEGLLASGFFWSSTKYEPGDAWFRLVSYGHADTKRSHTNINNAFSVRCVKEQ